MASCRLKQFTNPALLRTIDPACLVELLAPHRSFFEERGLSIPHADPAEQLDYERLISILARPDNGLPAELLDGLWLVDSMASPRRMDALLNEAHRLRLPIRDIAGRAPADLAIQIWLHQPGALGRLNAEKNFARRKSFRYFRGKAGMQPQAINLEKLVHLEERMIHCFMQYERGRCCQVLESPTTVDDERLFFVHHGEPIQREASVANGKNVSICYRPEAYDAVIYNSAEAELRVNAKKAEWLYELYRVSFGEFLFEDFGHFISASKYTLEPLKSLSRGALVCSEVPEVEWVRLLEVQFRECGNGRGTLGWFSDHDLFEEHQRSGEWIPPQAHIVKATFRVKLYGGPSRGRVLSIDSSNVASYARDSEGPIFDRWLRARGFIRRDGKRDHAAEWKLRPKDRRLLGSARARSRPRAVAS